MFLLLVLQLYQESHQTYYNMSLVHDLTQQPILVYYNFRGQLQPLRNFFCYLEIPFSSTPNTTTLNHSHSNTNKTTIRQSVRQPIRHAYKCIRSKLMHQHPSPLQIHLDCLEQQKTSLPQQVMSHFKKFKIDKSQLPTLIHQDLMIEGHLPIMTYICRKYNATYLLGQTIQIRAKLQQILEIYFLKQPLSMLQFFKVADYAGKTNDLQQISEYRYRQLIIVLQSGYIKPICEYLHKQQNPKHVMGKPTLLDFLFLETCFYMIRSFDTTEQSYQQEKKSIVKYEVNEEKPVNFYFRVMEEYLNTAKQQPFYVKYKDYLESFKIYSSMSTQQRIQGLQKIWLGDPKYVT